MIEIMMITLEKLNILTHNIGITIISTIIIINVRITINDNEIMIKLIITIILIIML